MATLVRIAQIETLQGQTTVLHDIDWQQFEAILEDLGDKRASRIAYFDGVLEIQMPLKLWLWLKFGDMPMVNCRFAFCVRGNMWSR